MIKAIIFDWGGVIIEEPSAMINSYCAKMLGVTVEAFLEIRHEHMPNFQRGHISEELFWQRICNSLGVGLPPVSSLWGDVFKNAYRHQEETIALAKNLKQQGYRLGFLSTTEMPAVEHFYNQRYDFFDAAVFLALKGA